MVSVPLTDGARMERVSGELVIGAELDGVLRWVEPAHSRSEILARERELEEQLSILPPGLQDGLRRRLPVLAIVSVAEGGFDGIATHRGDPAASLGIFQWAMARDRTLDEGSSLSRFFRELKQRATQGHESIAREFYLSAWATCRGVGLDVKGSVLSLRGKPATGAQLEAALQHVMGAPPLRAYQLVAANDWVERIGALPIRVAGGTRSVRELLADDRALSTAVLLGVNRPAYVVPALERAVSRVGGAPVDRLLREFRRQALALYRPAERERRMMRLLTSEASAP
jgi:hypothetical protein